MVPAPDALAAAGRGLTAGAAASGVSIGAVAYAAAGAAAVSPGARGLVTTAAAFG